MSKVLLFSDDAVPTTGVVREGQQVFCRSGKGRRRSNRGALCKLLGGRAHADDGCDLLKSASRATLMASKTVR